jgi:hypothetical protein
LTGLECIQLGIRANFMVVEALRACDRLFKKVESLIHSNPNGELPFIVYDMYGNLPLTVHSLKWWAEQPTTSLIELQNRIDVCRSILQQELRANGMFEKLQKKVVHIKKT